MIDPFGMIGQIITKFMIFEMLHIYQISMFEVDNDCDIVSVIIEIIYMLLQIEVQQQSQDIHCPHHTTFQQRLRLDEQFRQVGIFDDKICE
jgi:hypothetical protein